MDVPITTTPYWNLSQFVLVKKDSCYSVYFFQGKFCRAIPLSKRRCLHWVQHGTVRMFRPTLSWVFMMTSSNENIFHVTGPLWGESTGYRWIPLTKASDAELWCFLSSAPEQTVGQTIETPVIWDAIALIMTSMLCHSHFFSLFNFWK